MGGPRVSLGSIHPLEKIKTQCQRDLSLQMAELAGADVLHGPSLNSGEQNGLSVYK